MLLTIKNISRLTALTLGLFSGLSFAQYGENFESKWEVNKSRLACELKYDLKGYGEAHFIRKPGEDLSFKLWVHAPTQGPKNEKKELVFYRKNPDWVDSGSLLILGSVVYYLNKEQAVFLPPSLIHKNPDDYVFAPKTKTKNNKLPAKKVVLKKEPENKLALTYKILKPNDLWQILESGSSLQFQDPNTNRSELISVVGFNEKVSAYQECIAKMVPYDFDSIKLSRIYFPSGSAALTSEAKEKLDMILNQVKHDEYISKIEIGGHADIVGGYSDNRILANRRLWAVKDYLVLRGVPNDLVDARGYGDTKPIAPHNSKEGREKNRRVEIKLFH